MGVETSRVEDLFAEAVGRSDPAERAAYVERACGGDQALRRRVVALLASHDAQDSFLDGPAFPAALDAAGLIAEGPGAVVGRYKLLQLIGEGGFGSVFMAEQDHPVRRTVALKVVKLGMDTKQVIARFEAERQALALMDHPNIAKVLDAGATDAGRPYFVMELVRGVPITEYCDNNSLSTRERLELFVPVCHAVQHAHQKGVIHRDIKPSNVMVTLADGKPVPKVIDFGVAKATGHRLTERTLFTEYRQLIGTPEYMSPEQAEMSGIDIDTRSDVYSLGVLLYELLTGTTPFDPRELRSKAYAEIQRMIREVEPPRPSTRISSLGPTLAAVAARRRAEPRKLGQLMSGELDWIVMKALEKDRNRRYETSSGLATDVQRYLADEPVHACPPTPAYRLGKFARRNRAAVLTGSGVVASLLVLVIGLAVSNRMIAASRNEAAHALRQKELALNEAEAQRRRAEEHFVKARAAVQDVLLLPALGRGKEGQLPEALRKKLMEAATRYYAGLGEEGSTDPSMRYDAAVGQRALGFLCKGTGDLKRSEELFGRAIVMFEALHREQSDNPDYRRELGWSLYMMSETLNAAGRRPEAEAAAQRAAGLYEGLMAERPEVARYREDAWWVYSSLASMHAAAGRTQDAAEMYRRRVNVNPADHLGWYDAAALYLWAGDVERYRAACRQMLDRFEESADERPEIAERTARTCALAPDSVPDFSRVERLARRSVTGTEAHEHRRHFVSVQGLTDYRGGRHEQAVEWLRRSTPNAAGTHYDASAFAILAMAHQRLGQADRATASLHAARAILAKKPAGATRTDWLHCEILCREAEKTLGN